MPHRPSRGGISRVDLLAAYIRAGSLKHWISDRAVALIKYRRDTPAGPDYNLARRIIRRQVKVSVRTDPSDENLVDLEYADDIVLVFEEAQALLDELTTAFRMNFASTKCKVMLLDKRSHRVTWRPTTARQSWTKLNHVFIIYRWKVSIKDGRSSYGMQLNSGHAILRARLSIRFPTALRVRKHGSSIHQVLQVLLAHMDDEDCLEIERNSFDQPTKRRRVGRKRCKNDGRAVHLRNRFHEPSPEHFKGQSDLSHLSQPLGKPSLPEWSVHTSPPATTEIHREISILKPGKQSDGHNSEEMELEQNANGIDLLGNHPSFQKGRKNVIRKP
ncbi:hypothetical protein CLF_100905 [Clonorchis sinensis]|uniref:Reverse transcriptase domain-containing protein n=1 Tax=Clonorchis sinensis TaxID=79923 RepID=G7Y4I4_CLOSI|nr:hypothetical protein CLF_100905 [Clonorchis sinensis]